MLTLRETVQSVWYTVEQFEFAAESSWSKYKQSGIQVGLKYVPSHKFFFVKLHCLFMSAVSMYLANEV